MRFFCFYSVVFILWLSQAGLAKVNSLKNEKDGQNWPRHRGDQALQGISYAKIGTKLKIDWEFKTGEFLKSSVVISKGLAFVGSETGMLFAISIEDGKEKWKYKTSLGIDAPPLVHGEIVYIGSTDGFLYALNIEDGKLLWKYETDGEIMGAPNEAVRPKFMDSVIVVGSYDNFVHCVNAQTGKLLWKFETQNYVNGVPTIYENKYVVFGGCDSVLYVVGLEDGKLIRSVEVEAPIAASVSISDGVGYVGNMDRAVMAFDVKLGDIVWNYRYKNFPYFSSPAITLKYVLIGGRDKGLHCIERISGKQKWRFSARGRIDSSPVVAGDKVIFGSMDGKLYILSLKDGKEITSYEIGEPISSTPAIINGRILVGCEDGSVYSFKTDPIK
jgi:outer membrane protein assembly factor BamB